LKRLSNPPLNALFLPLGNLLWDKAFGALYLPVAEAVQGPGAPRQLIGIELRTARAASGRLSERLRQDVATAINSNPWE
jgi:hypothetical protein